MTDRAALEELLRLRWSDGTIFVRGRLLAPPDVEALGAYLDERLQGVVTWRVEQGTLYLLTLNNVTDRRGVGVALLDAMLEMGRRKGFPFMRAMLSNDNIPALRFYQKRGFRIVAIHSGVVDMMRALKPSIPEIGIDGIPIRDEIELEIVL
jgi:GNAT superfamily N-acetyltransferase